MITFYKMYKHQNESNKFINSHDSGLRSQRMKRGDKKMA